MKSMFDCRRAADSDAPGKQMSTRIGNAQRQSRQRFGQFVSTASMQTAAKVVSGRKYQTWVGIFVIHKKIEKPISAVIKAVPPKNAGVFVSSFGASGKTRKLVPQ